MSNIRALRPQDISPAVVINNIAEEVQNFEAIYVVGIMKEGPPLLWASGDLQKMCHASVLLNDMAMKYTRGEIDNE